MLVYELTKFSHLLRLNEFTVIMDSNTVLHWSTMKVSGKPLKDADLISLAKHLADPTPLCIDSRTQGKEELYPVQWSKVNNIS